MTDATQRAGVSGLRAVAENYLRDRFPGRPLADARYVRPVARLDERFCAAVARYHEWAPPADHDVRTAALYRALRREDLRQYRALRVAGVVVRPWPGAGQPYPDSASLIERVRATGTLWVYRTEVGHGPAGPPGSHPMRAPSGVVVDGVPLCHNDILRAVHDVFGHVALGAGFGPRGEFEATYAHLRLYPRRVWPVLFTEQVGQVCWFFFGDHLRDGTGRLRVPGDPGYLAPAARPYPSQKIFLYPQRFLDGFADCFRTG